MDREHQDHTTESRLSNVESVIEPIKALGSLTGELEGYNKMFRVIIIVVAFAVAWAVNDQNYKKSETDFRVEQAVFNKTVTDKVRVLEDEMLGMQFEIKTLKEQIEQRGKN